jgi:hypothetical protein
VSYFVEVTLDPDVSITEIPDSSVDYYVEVSYGNATELLTGIEDVPFGVEVSIPALPRTDYVIQTSGTALPTDPTIKVVYEVQP